MKKPKAKKRYFAPQPEVKYYNVVFNGKTIAKAIPYKGHGRKIIDNIDTNIYGIETPLSSGEDLLAVGGLKTKLYKRVINAFNKAYQDQLKTGEENVK